MKVKGRHHRSIWLKKDNERIVEVIDQRFLPHKFVVEELKTAEAAAKAIKEMHVRGAPLIGATAAFGMYLAALQSKNEKSIEIAAKKLVATRPTAVDLQWAVKKQLQEMKKASSPEEKTRIALNTAKKIADQSAEECKKIGEQGFRLIKEISEKKNNQTVNILTHCNAGWLACVDFGTATAPIYKAFDEGIKLHVWVDETRPRNQGAGLTAWELLNHGVPHTVIVDNAGGHLMQHKKVDLCIMGTDRTTVSGDVANKIGTYLKALAAKDNNIPFYVAVPLSSFDWEIKDGVKDIPIEERNPDEVKFISGLAEGKIRKVLLTPKNSPAANYGFDVTPARLVSGLITARGICRAEEKSILELFPEFRK